MINEDMLKEAAAELSEFQLQALHALEGEHAFSGKFQRKMKRLIHKVDHPIRHVLTNVAAVFVAVIITVSTLLFLSPDVRAAVTKWITHYSDDCVSCYHHGGEEPQKLDYVLGEIPEGYTLQNVKIGSNSIEHMYTDINGEYMYFVCFDGSEMTHLHFSGQDVEYLRVDIGGTIAELFLSKDGTNSTVIWQDQEGQLLFAIHYKGSQEELIRMAQSVRKK